MFKNVNSKTPVEVKVMIPLIVLYLIILTVSIIPIPNMILAVITTFITLIAYFLIKSLLNAEKLIIKQQKKKLNTFHEMFVRLSEENKKLSGELEQTFHDFDKHVMSSKTDLFGRITYASKALQRVSGYTEEEMVGNPQNMLRHPEMDAATFEELWSVIQNDGIWSGKIKNKTKTGNYYCINAIISPIYDYNNNKIGYSAITQDVTLKEV